MSLIQGIRSIIQTSGFDVIRYHPRKHPLNFASQYKIQTVIDVGANVGDFIASMRILLPTAQIIAIEPQPEYAQHIKNRFFDDKNLRILECAVGDKNEQQTFIVNEYSPSSSLLPLAKMHEEAFPHAREKTKITVAARTLDHIMEEQKKIIHEPVFLKLDIQGYELQALVGATTLLSCTHIALIESSFVELYRGQALFEDIRATMEHSGLYYAGSTTTKYHPETRLPLFEDAIFIRGKR